MDRTPSIFIVDDDPQVCESLRLLVESVGLTARVYPSAQAFLDACDPDQPGCLVLDVRMPGMGGLELHEKLAQHGIELPVIIITGYGEVPMAVRAMKAGAVDFLQKPFSPQALLQRIQHAVHRDARARQDKAQRAVILARLARLTPRQNEVLTLVLSGKSNKGIAAELGVSPKAIESHRAKIMGTMQARNVVQLAQLAFASGRFQKLALAAEGADTAASEDASARGSLSIADACAPA